MARRTVTPSRNKAAVARVIVVAHHPSGQRKRRFHAAHKPLSITRKPVARRQLIDKGSLAFSHPARAASRPAP